MRFLLSTTAGAGHVRPLVDIARAVRQRGHRVLIVGPPGVASFLNDDGVDHQVVGAPSDTETTEFWSAMACRPRGEASRVIERDWFAGLCLRASFEGVHEAVARWRPDVIVREPCEYSAAIVADRRNVRHVQVAISSGAAEAAVVRTVVAGELDRYGTGLADRLFHAPFLTRFPSSLDPSTFPQTLRYRVGAPVPRRPRGARSSKGGRPLVYVTFGSLPASTPESLALLREVVATLRRLDVRLLVTLGRGVSPDTFGVVPANVRLASWIDQDDALSQAAVVVCHGGSGTTYGALAAGIPLVMMPVTADQPTNARTIHAAGAGINVLDVVGSSAENIAALRHALDRVSDAVLAILDDDRFRRSAESVAEEMRRAPSIDEVMRQVVESSDARGDRLP